MILTVQNYIMNSQKKIVNKIMKRGGDYTLCIKGNHKNLREEIKAYFHKMKREHEELMAVHEDTDSGHGRVEKRVCRQLRVSEWITEAEQWEGIQTVIELERERHFPNKRSQHETQYYISSKVVDAKAAADAIRGHWEVENKAHWVLDVTFKEDDSRIRKDDGAENRPGSLGGFV